MGGFAFYGPYDDNNPTVEESLFQISTNPRYYVEVPTFHTLIYIMKHFPNILTDITEEYILDRAASSSLSKALLIVQVAWFCTNCASRLSQGLPLSLLEVSTAAHASCTLLTYFVWWSKPVNVAAPTLMREKEAREVYALLKCSDGEYDEALEMARKRAAGGSSALTGHHESAKVALAANALHHLLPTAEKPPTQHRFRTSDKVLLPGRLTNKSSNEIFTMSITTAISPMLYGLVHFLAWNDNFPTPLERVFWRASSFVVTCSGFAGVFVFWPSVMLDDFLRSLRLDRLMFYMSFFVIPAIHMLASGFLIVESFRQLCFLDSTAYQLPSWSNYWPHLS